MTTKPDTLLLILMAFADAGGRRFYRIETARASLSAGVICKTAGASPLPLVAVHVADIITYGLRELITLLVQQALADQRTHGEWYFGARDEAMMQLIADALSPDKVTLAWRSVEIPRAKAKGPPKRMDLALRRARASARNSLVRDEWMRGPTPIDTNVGLADVRRAYGAK